MCSVERVKERIGRGVWEAFHSFPYTLWDAAGSPEALAEGARAYRAMVESVFLLYPCASCRGHIQEMRAQELRRLDGAIAAHLGAASPLPLIQALCLWAFRLHNRVTRRKRPPGARAVLSSRYLDLESAAPSVILEALSSQYNIVYDFRGCAL